MPDYWKNLAQVDPAALLRQVRREQAERNLPEFIRQAWPVIEPGTTFIDNWHIDCIGEYLEAVNRGQITRLIVNMPPRHMKSLEITVCYPAYHGDCIISRVKTLCLRLRLSEYETFMNRRSGCFTHVQAG